jgi:SAM-dependent methyltransferase
VTATALDLTLPWYRVRETCRVCGTELPAPYLDLGMQPLANALRAPHDRSPERHAPLQVVKCPTCHLSQLTIVVEPDVLFHRDYPFASGTSRAWHVHCAALAVACGYTTTPRFVIDVAANDGTQLIYFKREGWDVLGVDPAHVPTVLVGTGGHEVHATVPFVHCFWSEKIAAETVTVHGPADLIVAQNVLGHVDDPIAFLKACKRALSPTGRVVIEVPHVGALLDQVAFDTVYHEHLSYWSLPPLEMAAEAAGLVVVDVEQLTVHGGSRRYWLARQPHPVSTKVIEERTWDEALGTDEPYREFMMRTRERLSLVTELLRSVGGKRLWAYGASAKGAVMLNALRLVENDVWPTRIVDDTPAKEGLLVPGVGIRVMKTPDSLALVDVLWLLSWNWVDALMRRAREHGFRGQFLVTHPVPRLVPHSIEPDVPDDCVPIA